MSEEEREGGSCSASSRLLQGVLEDRSLDINARLSRITDFGRQLIAIVGRDIKRGEMVEGTERTKRKEEGARGRRGVISRGKRRSKEEEKEEKEGMKGKDGKGLLPDRMARLSF